MLDRVVLVHVLNFGVGNAAVIFKKWRKVPAGNVTALVDGGGKDGAAVFTVPNRVVGAATKKRNAKRGTGDDHTLGSPFHRIKVLTNPRSRTPRRLGSRVRLGPGSFREPLAQGLRTRVILRRPNINEHSFLLEGKDPAFEEPRQNVVLKARRSFGNPFKNFPIEDVNPAVH